MDMIAHQLRISWLAVQMFAAMLLYFSALESDGISFQVSLILLKEPLEYL